MGCDRSRKALLGYQFCDHLGRNIAGERNDPSGLESDEVMSPDYAAETCSRRSQMIERENLLLTPIYSGDIEDMVVIGLDGGIMPPNRTRRAKVTA